MCAVKRISLYLYLSILEDGISEEVQVLFMSNRGSYLRWLNMCECESDCDM